jgi:hypothetical protein
MTTKNLLIAAKKDLNCKIEIKKKLNRKMIKIIYKFNNN